MKSIFTASGRSATRGVIAGFLAVSTLAWAQNSSPAEPSSSNPNGGWKRVGDQSQVYTPASDEGQDPQANASGATDPNPPISPRQSTRPPSGYPSISNGQNGPEQSPEPLNSQQPNYPAAPIPSQLTIKPGTYLTVRVNQTISSDKNQPGDAFTASLVQPIVVNGVVVAEPGQTIGGRVATAQKHHYDTPARLGLALTNLTLVDGQQVPINTQFVSRQGGTTPRGQEVGTVAATTGVGAAIGAIAGWGTGAAIGAGAGAAAGLIGVLVTHNHASVIYPEQVLTFRVETPVTFSTVNSSQAFRYVQPNEYDRPVYSNNSGNGAYESAAPPPPVYRTYAYDYPYYGTGWGWGWGYPSYWGPSFAFYGGYWGHRSYPRGYYGGRYYTGGGYYGGRAYAGSGFRGGVGGGGLHGSGGHRR